MNRRWTGLGQFFENVVRAFKASLTSGGMLLKWSWVDWILLFALPWFGVYAFVFAILWLILKLSAGEDFKELKKKEKAFYYYQQELKNSHYLVGTLKRQLKAASEREAESPPSSHSASSE